MLTDTLNYWTMFTKQFPGMTVDLPPGPKACIALTCDDSHNIALCNDVSIPVSSSGGFTVRLNDLQCIERRSAQHGFPHRLERFPL